MSSKKREAPNSLFDNSQFAIDSVKFCKKIINKNRLVLQAGRWQEMTCSSVRQQSLAEDRPKSDVPPDELIVLNRATPHVGTADERLGCLCNFCDTVVPMNKIEKIYCMSQSNREPVYMKACSVCAQEPTDFDDESA